MNNTFIFLFAISSILSFHESVRAQQQYKQRDFFALISTSLLMYDADIHVDRSNEELEDDSLRENYSGGYGFESVFGAYASDFLSVGIGVGHHQYTEINLLTLPIFFEIRLWEKAPVTKMTYLRVGGMARLNERYGRGIFAELGMGFKFLLSNKIPMTFNAFLGASGVSFTDEGHRVSDKTARMTRAGFTLGFFF